MLEAVVISYEMTVLSWGALGLLLLIQLIVADVLGIRAKHTPGAPIAANHDDLLFRATRAVANTNESIAIYIVLVLFCIFSGADATYTGYLSWAYVGARTAYAICYLVDQRMLRSICFGLSLVALVLLLVAGVTA